MNKRIESKFHALYTSSDGTLTFYNFMATSKRMAEVICQECIDEGMVDDLNNKMVSFLVMTDDEYKDLPKTFLEKFVD